MLEGLAYPLPMSHENHISNGYLKQDLSLHHLLLIKEFFMLQLSQEGFLL
jgi:hypothetical protein